MKRSLIIVAGLLLIGSATLCVVRAQDGTSTQPTAPTTKAADWLTCSFGEVKGGAITVSWEFRNISSEEVWIPTKFSVTERDEPNGELPLMFLVPGARLMSVAAMFSQWPDEIGIEEGHPKAELVRVAPRDTLSGKSSVALPFTWKDPVPPSGRPNPFTPWGAGNYAVPLDEMKIGKITTFQMAVQTYRLPKAMAAYYMAHHPTSDGRMVVDDADVWDEVKHGEGSGRYWASCVTTGENRMPRAGDCAEWVVSPVYKVDWAVGSHPSVGFKK